jgi:cytochrome c peroxidase
MEKIYRNVSVACLVLLPFVLLVSCNSTIDKFIHPIGEAIYPDDNPRSMEIAELGKSLFFDQRLSPDNTIACASCHFPQRGFTDGKSLSQGFDGRETLRNAPTLLNIGFHPYFMHDGGVATLEMQALVPLRDTAEMNNDMRELILKLNAIPEYHAAAKRLFNREFDAFVLTRALANFQRELISVNSPFDRWYYQNDLNAVSAEVKKGFELFNSLQCVDCHTPPAFTNYQFMNNGSQVDYRDPGRFRITGDSADIGAFKVPNLRNIALTGPYMHNGSFSDLSQVLDHYISGGNSHINQDSRIKKRSVSEKDKQALLLFLESLTDTSYLKWLMDSD